MSSTLCNHINDFHFRDYHFCQFITHDTGRDGLSGVRWSGSLTLGCSRRDRRGTTVSDQGCRRGQARAPPGQSRGVIGVEQGHRQGRGLGPFKAAAERGSRKTGTLHGTGMVYQYYPHSQLFKNYNIFPLLKISYQLRIQIYLYYFLSKIVYHTVKFLWTLLQNFASSNNHQVV
jgi:hypothetical protein